MPSNFQHGVSSYGIPLFGGGGLSPLHPERAEDVFFVDDVNGNNGNTGQDLEEAFATITYALSQVTNGRNSIIYVAPGEYNENVNVNKRNVAIIGSSGRHPGITRITGNGLTAQPTIRVDDGYLRGFVLANVHVDTGPASGSSQAQPAIRLQTNDTGTLGATSDDYHGYLYNVDIINDSTATIGILLDGATMVKIDRFTIANCVRGLVFRSNANNNPTDNVISNGIFYGNTTYDIGSQDIGGGDNSISIQDTLITGCHFMDIGGTPVTNYVQFTAGGTATHINVLFTNCYFARSIADGTLTQLPVGCNIVGSYSVDGIEGITGA